MSNRFLKLDVGLAYINAVSEEYGYSFALGLDFDPKSFKRRGGSSALDDSALTDEPQTLEMNFGKGLLPDEAKAEFRPGAVAWKGLGNTQAQQLPLETNSLPKLNPKPFAKKET